MDGDPVAAESPSADAQQQRKNRRLQAEVDRLTRLLRLTAAKTSSPSATRTAIRDQSPGLLHNRSSEEEKINFLASLCAACTDMFARRRENSSTGTSGWMPATLGRWQKGGPRPRFLP